MYNIQIKKLSIIFTELQIDYTIILILITQITKYLLEIKLQSNYIFKYLKINYIFFLTIIINIIIKDMLLGIFEGQI